MSITDWDDIDTASITVLPTRHPSLHPSWWMEDDDDDGDDEVMSLLGVTEFGGFLNDGGRTLTTWNGVKLADVTSLVRLERYTPSQGFVGFTCVRAVDTHGQEWYGRSPGMGLYAHMRRKK